MQLLSRSLASVLLAAAVTAPVAAQPVASLPAGFSFVDWLTVNDAPVGVGAVDDDHVVYFLKERQVGALQSWLLFFDPNAAQAVRGTITFDAPIAALYTSTQDVAVTSAAYQLVPPVTYGAVAATGLEPGDDASFAGNVLTFDWTASDPGDHVRVLTTVPEPATWVMVATGLALVAAVRRRRAAG